MLSDTIAVVGYGYVGKALVRFFRTHYNVLVYDPYVQTLEQADVQHNVRFADVSEINRAAGLAIISVPTPQRPDGRVDTTLVEKSVELLAHVPLICIKSTVAPGTTERLLKTTGKRIVFSPEFIGEGNYVIQWWKDAGHPHPTDMKYHDFQIFGGKPEDTSDVMQFFKRVLGPEIKYIQTNATKAELVKYAENSWIATKVTFFNEWYGICEAFGQDFDDWRELMLNDSRVGRSHSTVFKHKRGFDGKCIPKDTSAIVSAAKDAGYLPTLLEQVLTTNEQFLKKNRS